MNCHEIQDLLHGYLDDELDVVSSLAIEQHLQDCALLIVGGDDDDRKLRHPYFHQLPCKLSGILSGAPTDPTYLAVYRACQTCHSA